MTEDVIKVTGLKDVQRTLQSLADIEDTFLDHADEICEVMREDALSAIQENKAVDTGELRNSVKTKDADFTEKGQGTVSIGIHTKAKHAIFIEYGTGPLGDPAIPHTSKKIWFQHNPDYNPLYGSGDAYGRDREWIPRYPQRPRPFMRPALYENREVFKAMMEGYIKEVFDE